MKMLSQLFGAFGIAGFVLAALSAIPAWITHVVYCINHELWIFLLAGGLVAPIGVIHGWGIWFGWWA